MILKENNMNIPSEWQYPSTFDDSDNSPAMIEAMKGKPIDKKLYHNPL